MNESKKGIIVVGIMLLIIIAIPVIIFMGNKKSNDMYKGYEERINGTELSLIYIGRPTCSVCLELDPVIKEYKQKYNFEYYYVNTDKLVTKDTDKLINSYEGFSEGISTPTLLYVQNGQIVDAMQGFLDEKTLFNFLQKNGSIDANVEYEGKVDEDEINLNVVSVEQYLDVVESGTKSIINIARVGCGACQTAKPILNKVAGTHNLTVNYFNTDNLTSDNIEAFTESLEFISSGEFQYTPTLMIVENGKVVETLVGVATEDEYVALFKKHGFIK